MCIKPTFFIFSFANFKTNTNHFKSVYFQKIQCCFEMKNGRIVHLTKWPVRNNAMGFCCCGCSSISDTSLNVSMSVDCWKIGTRNLVLAVGGSVELKDDTGHVVRTIRVEHPWDFRYWCYTSGKKNTRSRSKCEYEWHLDSRHKLSLTWLLWKHLQRTTGPSF